jgi:hypothetical protein
MGVLEQVATFIVPYAPKFVANEEYTLRRLVAKHEIGYHEDPDFNNYCLPAQEQRVLSRKIYGWRLLANATDSDVLSEIRSKRTRGHQHAIFDKLAYAYLSQKRDYVKGKTHINPTKPDFPIVEMTFCHVELKGLTLHPYWHLRTDEYNDGKSRWCYGAGSMAGCPWCAGFIYLSL